MLVSQFSFEKENTTGFKRYPRNLLHYASEQINDDLFFLLAKHYKNIREFLGKKNESSEIDAAVFVIKLNKFEDDLINIADMCAEISLKNRIKKERLEVTYNALRSCQSEQLLNKVRDFYKRARNYDRCFAWRNSFFKPGESFFDNSPFYVDPDLSNEENIFRLVNLFNEHDNFFKNFLNVFYSDGEDGVRFLGMSFEAVCEDYTNIKKNIVKISNAIEECYSIDFSIEVDKDIEVKCKRIDEIMEKYPATLYLATKNILYYLDKSVKAN